MRRVIVLTASGLMLGACSSAMPSLDFLKSAPQSETLAIESVPPGVEAKTSLGQSCRTPCQLAVQPGSEFSVTFALSGYQTQTVSVRPEADGASAPQLTPNPVQVALQRSAPPKKPVAKKHAPVATASRPAAPPPMASAAPPSAPSVAPALAPAATAPAESAPSATDYPWASR